MVFQQLHYFIAVAECGSINGAAERLFISQQSLRASINSLEQKLGFALFYRSAKGMRLTVPALLCGRMWSRSWPWRRIGNGLPPRT